MFLFVTISLPQILIKKKKKKRKAQFLVITSELMNYQFGSRVQGWRMVKSSVVRGQLGQNRGPSRLLDYLPFYHNHNKEVVCSQRIRRSQCLLKYVIV